MTIPQQQQPLLLQQQYDTGRLPVPTSLEQQPSNQHSHLSAFIPSVILPPPSPTLSSYNYGQANDWVNNYYDPKRSEQVASRVSGQHTKRKGQDGQTKPHPSDRSDTSGQPSQSLNIHPHQSATLPVQQAIESSQVPQDHSTSQGKKSLLLTVPDLTLYVLMHAVAQQHPNIPMQTQWTIELRDSLLQYAHTLYSTTPSSPLLLPLLHSIHDAYPSHLPTILLLACVYYSHQDYVSSLQYNQLILKFDPQYVEAMSNIGTTLRILGRTSEAEKWWYQAVRLRPGYWDAVENLVGVLCSTPSPTSTSGANGVSTSLPQEQSHVAALVSRFGEALKVCNFVENHFYKPSKTSSMADTGGVSAPKRLPASQIPRLQNLFYAKGNLRSALGDSAGARLEYEKGLQLVFGGSSLVSIIHLLALVCGWTVAAAASRSGKLLEASSLPLILLQPDQVSQIMQLMYPHTAGILPGLVSSNISTTSHKQQPASASTPAEKLSNGTQLLVSSSILQQTMQTTSTILLNLAKLLQDQMNSPPKSGSTASNTPTLAILLPLYYLSLALNPSPSTANNLGIILSSLPDTVCSNSVQLTNAAMSPSSPLPPLTGTMRAMQYYMYGLRLDAQHPHLYTNLGSLLKDMGHLHEAICMYEKAVQFNPKFDVALANLGNAIKDQGRVQESVQFYRRAVDANPDFVDAICGLVNSLGGICDWRGRGTVDSSVEPTVNEEGTFVPAGTQHQRQRFGWMDKLVEIVDRQLVEGCNWGQGVLQSSSSSGTQSPTNKTTVGEQLTQLLAVFTCASTMIDEDDKSIITATTSDRIKDWTHRLEQWTLGRSQSTKNEGGWLIRLLERLMRRMQHHWYLQHFGGTIESTYSQAKIVADQQTTQYYQRPQIPSCLSSPPVPTVLPFHTFTYPLSARQIRLISHRNALRISHSALTSSWVAPYVYPPPPPPAPRLKIGYVSSDFNNHPLAHLMQSVFGFHDRQRYDVYCYATTPSDSTCYRQKIETETEHFLDVSQWSNQQVVEQILEDGIHLLVNLNGYTKGARNEIFAARPCPVQCSFMGFAGTLGGGWVDYFIADPVVCPPSTVSGEVYRQRLKQDQQGVLMDGIEGNIKSDFEGDLDPEEPTDDFVYTEKFIYMPHSYFVNDHKQGFQEGDTITIASDDYSDKATDMSWAQEEDRRWTMRHKVFPDLADDTVIFANFNQLYKLEPSTFRLWLRILERVPNSVLWLLRFPPAGEQHLKQYAMQWSGKSVAQRLLFTDVAPKHVHIHRGRVADLFLDTPECNAHTTAADILWSGTPIVTYPKYEHKMCSRVGASIAYATGFGDQMVVDSERGYEERAVQWAKGLSYTYHGTSQRRREGKGDLMDLRKKLFLTREQSRLFDTQRWTRNLEQGYREAWRRWVMGEEMEDLAPSALHRSGSIWISDPDDGSPAR